MATGDTPPPKKKCVRSSNLGGWNDACFLHWAPEKVCEYFRGENLLTIAETLEEHKVSGEMLIELSDEDLKQMSISKSEFKPILKKLKRNSEIADMKVFSDPIHGPIEMHPLMVRIIDTPEFQRLRSIKQLGGTYYVYPGGSHNRYEHSLGVAHLAGELVEKLRQNQPELNITDQDVLCVKIAGLCHDLGHGPFSHMFDSIFIPAVRKDKKWKHELASAEMFDHLIYSNNLEKYFKMYGLDNEDIIFVKEQIRGPVESEFQSQPQGDWPYIGRDKTKSFLYEIVANKRNGMDVDKWDYFARDCHHLGIGCTFDHRRYMAFARVIPVDERMQICTRDKDVNYLYDMFYVRKNLHQRAYQHKTGNAIEHMVRDALLLANDHFLIPGEGRKYKMSECIDDMAAYSKLNDSVLDMIMFSGDPALRPAQEMIHRIETRQIYKYIAQTAPVDSEEHSYRRNDGPEIAEEILTHRTVDDSCLNDIKPANLLVDIVTFDYGSKKKNPIDNMRFYGKNNPDKAIKLTKGQVSHMLPSAFSEQCIRLYCKKVAPEAYHAIWRCFKRWCGSKEFGLDQQNDTDEDVNTPYTTPFKSSQSRQNSERPHGAYKSKKALFQD